MNIFLSFHGLFTVSCQCAGVGLVQLGCNVVKKYTDENIMGLASTKKFKYRVKSNKYHEYRFLDQNKYQYKHTAMGILKWYTFVGQCITI